METMGGGEVMKIADRQCGTLVQEAARCLSEATYLEGRMERALAGLEDWGAKLKGLEGAHSKLMDQYNELLRLIQSSEEG